MRKVSALLLVIGGLLENQKLMAQAAWFEGQAADYQTRQFLPATWQWLDATNRIVQQQKVGKAGFVGGISFGARFLYIESAGYRSVRLPVHWPSPTADTIHFRAIVPLVPIDKMPANRPYLQSEQKPVELPGSSATHQRVRVHFIIQDALTHEPVRAELCLFHTKAKERLCDSVFSVKTKATVQDIIAIEARAIGYQPYLGNLVVGDSPGKEPALFRIHLNPTPTIMMMTSEQQSASRFFIKAIPSRKTYPLNPLDSIHWTAVVKPGHYQLIRQVDTIQMMYDDDTLQLQEGLNGYIYGSSANADLPPAVVNPTIYFSQSSYELTVQARQQLDQIVSMMKREPHRHLLIVGHTDSIGDRYLNMVLSEFRARTIRAYLHRQGIAEQRLSIEAKGDSQPIVANDTEDKRRQNRRANLYFR